MLNNFTDFVSGKIALKFIKKEDFDFYMHCIEEYTTLRWLDLDKPTAMVDNELFLDTPIHVIDGFLSIGHGDLPMLIYDSKGVNCRGQIVSHYATMKVMYSNIEALEEDREEWEQLSWECEFVTRYKNKWIAIYKKSVRE